MNFDLDAAERDLQQGMRDVLAGRFPMARIREMEPTGVLDRDLWRDLGRRIIVSCSLSCTRREIRIRDRNSRYANDQEAENQRSAGFHGEPSPFVLLHDLVIAHNYRHASMKSYNYDG